MSLSARKFLKDTLQKKNWHKKLGANSELCWSRQQNNNWVVQHNELGILVAL